MGIVSINPDGSGEAKLNDELSPFAWSPDGTRIAFDCHNDFFLIQNTNSGICLMNADGTNVTPVPHTGNLTHSAWSPDGTKLAVIGLSGDYLRVITINTDGSGLKVITPNFSTTPGDPTWSPDGTRIAFSANHTGRPGGNNIYTVESEGASDPVSLSRGYDYSEPQWSPDGTKLLVLGQASNGTDRAIYTLDAANGSATRLSPPADPFAFGSTGDYEPAWSPDETQIVFHRDLANLSEGTLSSFISIMDADGRNRHDIVSAGSLSGGGVKPGVGDGNGRYGAAQQHGAIQRGHLHCV